jgi:hypothetical protein
MQCHYQLRYAHDDQSNISINKLFFFHQKRKKHRYKNKQLFQNGKQRFTEIHEISDQTNWVKRECPDTSPQTPNMSLSKQTPLYI